MQAKQQLQRFGAVNWLFRSHSAPAGITVAKDAQKNDSGLTTTANPGNVGLMS
jgi:hypothetical protein